MKKDLTRRDVLRMTAAAGGLGALAACSTSVSPAKGPAPAAPPRMPVVFISHGSPMVAVAKDDYVRAIRKMGEELPLPKAVVMISAHWVEPAPILVGSAERPETIHDFGGFPKELYEIQYPAPGEPKVAADVVSLLNAAGLKAQADAARGLDHGAWVPMRIAYPGADVPVLQVTLNEEMPPAQLVALGRSLAPLRSRGILLVGSGGMVHNLGHRGRPGVIEPWAKGFDEWVRARIDRWDLDSLVHYQALCADAEMAHPTTEHFDPLFFVLGAATKEDRVRDVHEGFAGSLSMRTLRFG